MSELFDFLKRTERDSVEPSVGDGSSRSAIAVSEEPILEQPTKAPITDGNHHASVTAEAVSRAEDAVGDGLDLGRATDQLKYVLNSQTLVGEQFRLLRSKLGLLQKQRGCKTLLVTSSVPNEGKTFTSSSLAGVFAQELGKRVLLIDADMRKVESGACFGLNGSWAGRGLSHVLRDEQGISDAVISSETPALSFMPSGALPSNPSELLSSPKMEQLLRTASASFDWVVVDSPPVLAVSDTMLIAPLCDAVVLVVRANGTPSKLVLETIEHVGRERICGVVLNRQMHVKTSRYYYQYYYRGSKPKKG